ncbi:villin-2-like [Bidens hawaiensis]|uniref:villin-2-like n=1 Tax=Bidens hawaiensis TaxID=980011 RepID=UPI0040491845
MSVKVSEPAFQGVGQKVGIEIWRLENLQPVPLPTSDYGRFYYGDSYIVLKVLITTGGKAGAYTYDIHFWLGKDTSQDESGTAAVKAVELDAVLGTRAIQYREPQSHESKRLLSYFKPCLMPLDGGFSAGIKTPEDENFETKLYTCEGKRAVRLKQVPFTRSTLNHDEIFILETKEKIYQFNGANTNMQERTKALEVVQLIKDKYHEGTCSVAIIEDGKLQSEGQSGEFWNLFGGFAPIGKKVASEDDIMPEKMPPKLYCIAGGQIQDVIGELSKSLLRTDKSYVLYCGTHLFIWVGRATRLEDRKTATQTAEEFIVNHNVSKLTTVTRVIQGHETNLFKSNFGSWTSASSAPPFEEGRGKVAAMLKQQGAILKGQAKTSLMEEEVPPLLPENGELEVWHIDGESKTPVPKEDIGKFYGGDCYIIQYSYDSNDKKDHYLCCWIGKDSMQEDQTSACQQTTSMFKSLKCKVVQGRVHQGKEPPQFIAIFQPMIVLKGGLSPGYKSYIAEKGLKDVTYSPDTSALIEIAGTSVHNNKALQIDLSATNLNSYGCFILQSATSVLTWYGNQSTVEQQQLATKVVEFLKPGAPSKFSREGKESLAFWLALGGKQSYNSKKLVQEIVREPHLFGISSNKGKFEIEEIYSFEQDDLLAEDIMILDTHAEVIVWVGQSVDPKEKQSAFETGQKYIDLAASVDGLSPYVPLFRVQEGSEPCFFTTYFSWDPSKASAQGNSFKKKAMLLFGPGVIEPEVSSRGGGATQRASAMAALTSAFKSSNVPKTTSAPRIVLNRASQRAAAVAALSNVLTAERKGGPPPPDSPRKKSPKSESTSPLANPEILDPVPASAPAPAPAPAPVLAPDPDPVKTKEPPSDTTENNEASEAPSETTEPNQETNEEDSSVKETAEEEKGCEDTQSTYTYDQLISKSTNPVTGIDLKKRETYLSPEEFEEIFKMPKEKFYGLPRWKQDHLKKKVDLF